METTQENPTTQNPTIPTEIGIVTNLKILPYLKSVYAFGNQPFSDMTVRCFFTEQFAAEKKYDIREILAIIPSHIYKFISIKLSAIGGYIEIKLNYKP